MLDSALGTLLYTLKVELLTFCVQKFGIELANRKHKRGILFMKTIKEAWQQATARLYKFKINDAELDAWYLLSFVTGLTRAEFFVKGEELLTEEQEAEYEALLARRTSHEPLQYIIGTQEFMGLSFVVRDGVLIPRQETELLVEEVLPFAKEKSVLDMCTGSGCIILSLAKMALPKQAVGVYISERALDVAKENGKRLEVPITWVQSNLFETVEGTFDVIVSNPPYISSSVIPELMPEVREYEPLLALDGKEDGLFFYREIIKQAKEHLVLGGRIFFEIGHDQGEAVSKLLLEEGYSDIKVKQDYAGLDRIVSARYGE